MFRWLASGYNEKASVPWHAVQRKLRLARTNDGISCSLFLSLPLSFHPCFSLCYSLLPRLVGNSNIITYRRYIRADSLISTQEIHSIASSVILLSFQSHPDPFPPFLNYGIWIFRSLVEHGGPCVSNHPTIYISWSFDLIAGLMFAWANVISSQIFICYFLRKLRNLERHHGHFYAITCTIPKDHQRVHSFLWGIAEKFTFHAK